MAATKDKDVRFRYDPNPQFANDIEYVEKADGTKIGVFKFWMAFDPTYGPETEAQIEWHRKHGIEGAENWEVGKPVKVKPVYP